LVGRFSFVGLLIQNITESFHAKSTEAWWKLNFFILMKLGLFICCYDLSKTTNTVCNNRVILKIKYAETYEMQVVLQLPI
jgi:hypothetical protein